MYQRIEIHVQRIIVRKSVQLPVRFDVEIVLAIIAASDIPPTENRFRIQKHIWQAILALGPGRNHEGTAYSSAIDASRRDFGSFSEVWSRELEMTPRSGIIVPKSSCVGDILDSLDTVNHGLGRSLTLDVIGRVSPGVISSLVNGSRGVSRLSPSVPLRPGMMSSCLDLL